LGDLIQDERDFAKHVDYLHYNPVKHGYVPKMRDWAYSTFHRYIKSGMYTNDWVGTNNMLEEKGYGE
jgi:putative transposase